MDNDRLLDPVVKAAFNALNDGDRDAWLGPFDSHAILTDDGNERDYERWSDSTVACRSELRQARENLQQTRPAAAAGTAKTTRKKGTSSATG